MHWKNLVAFVLLSSNLCEIIGPCSPRLGGSPLWHTTQHLDTGQVDAQHGAAAAGALLVLLLVLLLFCVS